ncbi:YfhO family protein [Streptomyces sp. MUM 178J]|uniref:YfhO family protein n=1 Tax=Streptomyces sp. MUM 178J TaxID=2791991 RepID=UPI001F047E42|nr:YfhO family protein [Streptomyces sp. MUM 178J]WRQ79782.1 YfhO family protein [Streptomyces sp. MUM 178J]
MPPPGPRTRAAALAALITVTAVCAGDAVARSFPFGPHTRSVNDLGNQFVPFHTRLWDLLHGRADGGLLINWQSGYGTSFLPDLGTYLTSPFALLVGLFPRQDIDLAVYVVTVLKMAAAAAAMALLLLTMRSSGRWWAAGVLGASYGLCGWSVMEASYNPMWLDGLVALPLLCLAGEWARTRQRPVLATLLVAAVWAANFYTAYMATLGAALVLAARLATERTEQGPVRALLRAAWTTALGVALAAPVLIPVYLGTTYAYPGWNRPFAPAAWPDVFARMLPATYSFFTPALFLGTGTLLLACALAFHRAAPTRERWVWTGLTAVVALSLQWGPTHLLWHAFATPNGSPYRQTFILAGVVVTAAWTAVAHAWPSRRALLGGCAVLAVIAAGASFSELVTEWTYPLLAAGLVAAAAALALVRHGRRYAVLAALLLAGAQAGQAAATTAYADRQRLNRLDDYAPWGDRQRTQAEAVAAADGWPRHRTEAGPERTTANDPLLVGGQGGAYYSSHTPEVLTRTLAALGGGWTSNGRAVHGPDNPVTDAIFSVGARVHVPRDPHQGWNRPDDRPVTVTRQETPPLVTVRPPKPGAPPVAYGRSAFRNQQTLLGSTVYTLPRTALLGPDGAAPAGRRLTPGAPYTLSARCPAGSEVHLWAPDFFGTAQLAGTADPVDFRGGLPKRRAAMQRLGDAVKGPVTVTLRAEKEGTVPREAIGCLDRGLLAEAVGELKRTGAMSVSVTGGTVRAELPAGTTGTAVFALPRIGGWSCEGRPADAYLGLVAVPVRPGDSSVECTFRTPGLGAGAAVGACALLAPALTALLRSARTCPRRRAAIKTSSGRH